MSCILYNKNESDGADNTVKHGVDMNTSLLTFDGFPRADIDVAQIRTTRARIIGLKNDHKALMAKLEMVIQEYFAAGKAVESSSSNAPSERAREVQQAAESTSSSSAIEPPFAKVNTVAPDSPAQQAGLLIGDKVIRFGMANWTNHERLAKVAQVVQQNENVRLLPLTFSNIGLLLTCSYSDQSL